MAQVQSRPVGRRIGGLALMLVAVAMIGICTHFLALSGNCSNTGYLPNGPAPVCGGGEGFYITGEFFVGPLIALIGWRFAQLSGVLWPLTCLGVGTGLFTVKSGSNAPAGAPSLGQVGGVLFFALAVLSVGLTIRNRRRKQHAALAGPPATPAPAGPCGRPGVPGSAVGFAASFAPPAPFAPPAEPARPGWTRSTPSPGWPSCATRARSPRPSSSGRRASCSPRSSAAPEDVRRADPARPAPSPARQVPWRDRLYVALKRVEAGHMRRDPGFS